jgi:hypothetical protein
MTNIVNTDFFLLINNALRNTIGDKTILPLNAYEIAFIQRVIAAEPTIFEGMVVNNSLVVNNIPQLVFVIFNAFKNKIISSDINVNIINIVEFTLTILIQSLAFGPGDAALLIEVLDFSIQLLRTELPIIEQAEQYLEDNFWAWTRAFFSGVTNCFRSCTMFSSCSHQG